MGILFLAHRRFQTDGILCQLQQFPHPVRFQIQLHGDFLHRGLPAIFAQQLPCCLFDPVDVLHQMHRNADGTALVCNRTGNGLPDPPGGVGGKLEAALRLKLFGRLHQAEVSFLNQVQKRQPPPDIALGHRHHQPQVGFAQSTASVGIPGLCGAGKVCFLLCREQRHPADLL